MGKKKRVNYDLLKRLKVRIVTGFMVISGVLGFVLQDELKSFLKETLFLGTVEIEASDDIMKNGSSEIIDGKASARYSYKLNEKTRIKLPAGNYKIQIFYPKADGTKDMIFEQSFDIMRWERKKLSIDRKLPKAMTLRIETPKNDYAKGEQFYLSTRSDSEGFLWFFSPDDSGNTNMFFPNEHDPDNHLKAGDVRGIPPRAGTYTLQVRNTVGKETLIGIITESNDRNFALACLRKIMPSVSVKISVTQETPWGYDKKFLNVK